MLTMVQTQTTTQKMVNEFKFPEKLKPHCVAAVLMMLQETIPEIIIPELVEPMTNAAAAAANNDGKNYSNGTGFVIITSMAEMRKFAEFAYSIPIQQLATIWKKLHLMWIEIETKKSKLIEGSYEWVILHGISGYISSIRSLVGDYRQIRRKMNK